MIRVISLFEELGLIIQYDKSVLTPQQSLTFLGFQFDSRDMTISLGQDKKKMIQIKCHEIINQTQPRIRDVAQLLGYMVAYSGGTEYGLLHYRNLEHDKKVALKRCMGDFDRRMHISTSGKQDISWWMHNTHLKPHTIWQANPQHDIYSDASLTGWGGVLGSSTARGLWSQEETDEHINVLELRAALLVLYSLCSNITNCHIRMFMDNTTAVVYVNNMGGSRSMGCNEVAADIWHWAIARNIWLSACHLPGVLNTEADAQSRSTSIRNEWKLDSRWFLTLCNRWGTPDVDLFASRIAHQVEKYVAWQPDPHAFHIDAFTMRWSDNFYAFPPFSVIDRCLIKIRRDGVHGILVVPRWTTRPWWASLMKMVQDTMIIKSASRHLTNPASGAHHPLKNLVLLAFQV